MTADPPTPRASAQLGEPGWRNEIVRLTDGAVTNWFLCTCPPDSSRHQRMVIGWLVNANTQVYCLRDGLTADARLEAAADRATPKEQQA